MPIHDWTRVPAGVCHDFHRNWTIEIRRALTRGLLPPGYHAMVERRDGGAGQGDVAARFRGAESPSVRSVAETPPRIAQVARAPTEAARYAARADRIAIREGIERVVAIIEVASPGNKDSRHAVASFVDKAVDFVRNGIHFLLIDPFPPGPHDPDGLARLIWEELSDVTLESRPADRTLTVAAFDAGPPLVAYVEPIAVGDALPEAPLFLAPGWYVDVPLERTYMASWEETPRPLRELVESPSSAG